MPESPSLVQRLEAVRARVRHLFVIHGAAQVAILAVVWVLATFLIDYSLPLLPAYVRLIFLASGFVGTGWAIWRWILYPLSVQITDDDIARCLEQQYPKLRDRLISSIQLARGGGSNEFNSAELVQALIAETATLTERLDFQAVVLPQAPRQRARMGFGAVGGLLLLGLFFPQYAGIYLKRIFGSDTRWPRKTILELTFPTGVVAKGEDFTVVVKVKEGSDFPSKAYFHYQLASGVEASPRMSRVADQEAFKYELNRVMEDFRFSVSGGDDQTAWYDMKVVTPLRLERLQVYLSYPKYMKLADTPAEKPDEAGNLKLPIGTKVRLRALANAPLARAQLLLGKRGQEQSSELALATDPTGAAGIAVGEFKVEGDSEYSVVITGQDGLVGRNPPRYLIKGVVDNGPILKITEPTAEKAVTAVGVIPIKATSKDDYGVLEVRLVHQFSNREKEKPSTVVFDSIHNDADALAKEINSRYEIDLAALKAKEGDSLTFHVEAEDACEVPGHNITRTRPFTFTVVAKTALEAQLDERRMKVKDELKKVLAGQEKQREELEKLRDELAGKEQLDRADRRSLAQAATAQQRHVAQRLERLVKELDEILKDVDNNKLWDVSSRDKVDAMRDILAEDVAKKSPAASTYLSQASQSTTPENRAENLQNAATAQDELAADMREVLDQMEEWEDYMEVVKIVRQLLERQTRLNEDIKRSGARPK